MKLKPDFQISPTVANLLLLAFLLFAIFFVMIFPPHFQKILYQICISCILFLALFCIDKKYRHFIRWVIGLVIVLIWANFFTDNFLLNSISKTFIICLYMIIAIWLVKQVASSKKISGIMILESVNGYLMIAMLYSIIIALVMLFNPEAYHFQTNIKNTEEILTNFNEYLYYGFNAFTTVTYGDVLPVSPVAKSVSMAMGFTGQMYVAIIIALLVGKFASQSLEK